MLVSSLSKAVNAADVPPERLAGNTTLTDQQKIAEASRQFEAILLRQILSATQKPVISSKLVDNSTSADIYRDMITNQLADSISKSGAFGLARTFEQQLTRPDHAGLAAHRPEASSTASPHAEARPVLNGSAVVEGRVPHHASGGVLSATHDASFADSGLSSLPSLPTANRPSLVNRHE
jgi:flagellar protein FlgJ